MRPDARAPAVPLLPVLLVNFIGTLGFSIVLPFLVFLVSRFGGNALVYGIVGATYPAFQFIGAPVLGRWSDRYGRKRILLLSQAGTFGSWLIFCVALLLPVDPLVSVHSALWGDFQVTWPLLVLLLARAVDGLTGGNISVANAYVADISSDTERGRNFARMGVAANLGLIVGPGLAGALGATAWGEALPVLAATAISALALALIAFRLPESNPSGRLAPAHRDCAAGAFGQEPLDCRQASALAQAGLGAGLRQRGVPLLLVLNFLLLLAFNFFYTAFPAHAVANMGWSVVGTGVFFAVLSLLLVVVEGPLLAWIAPRTRDTTLVVAGSAVLGANFLFMGSTQPAWVYVGAALFALGNGLMWPSLVSLAARIGGRSRQGVVQGLVGGVGSLAAIVGLVAGGLAFGLVGAATFAISAGLAFVAAALAVGLVPLVARLPADETG
jgi:MFS family permease